MRRPASALLALLLAVGALPLAGAPAAATHALASRLDALLDEFPGGASVWVGDPAAAQPLYARDDGRRLVTASLYKLAVLLEAEHRVDLGTLRYDDTIVIEEADITEDGSFEVPGTTLSLDEALERMITISDNGTAMHLWRTLGPSNINAFMVKSGIRDFTVARDETEENLASARAVGTYFTLLAKRQLVSPAASDRMLRRLQRQQINDRIPAQLPEGTLVAHKTGNLVGLVHDAGIISTRQGQRVLVAMTYDIDEDVASELIARLASAVYANAMAVPAAAAYRVTQDVQYVELGSTFTLDVGLDNIGEEAWALSGPASIGLVWEVRDTSNNVVSRGPRALAVGQVPVGGSVEIPVVVTLPTRAGDAKVVLGLVDASGRALSAAGVATATVPLRVHLPFVARSDVRAPSLMHRREASLIEIGYTALEAVRSEDHYLSLGWRFIDPATGRVIAQGAVPLGVLRIYERGGKRFAPLVAPNVRGTYVFEYEIRERGFVAGVTRRQEVEILAPRTFGDEAGPPSAPRPPGPRPTATPARTPLPTFVPSTSPRPAPRPSALP